MDINIINGSGVSGLSVAIHFIGRRIAVQHLRLWVFLCILSFVIGLVGFSFSTSILAWVLFTIIFTVGEIIIQPLEFIFITHMAPVKNRGAYYSAQNLAYLGAASTPVVCGFILAGFNPLYFILYLLVLLLVGGTILYVQGANLIPPGGIEQPRDREADD